MWQTIDASFKSYDLEASTCLYHLTSITGSSPSTTTRPHAIMPVAQPNQAETYLLACTSIVRDLIEAVSNPDPKREINLNALRKQYGKKYKMKGVPRLVDILSAVPEEWRDRLRGALRAKPVRTASGVSWGVVCAVGAGMCADVGR